MNRFPTNNRYMKRSGYSHARFPLVLSISEPSYGCSFHSLALCKPKVHQHSLVTFYLMSSFCRIAIENHRIHTSPAFTTNFSTQLHAQIFKMTTHYETLGLDHQATIEDIKKAYLSLQIKHQSDKTASLPEHVQKEYARISLQGSLAYEVLSDAKNCASHDVILPSPSKSDISATIQTLIMNQEQSARPAEHHAGPFPTVPRSQSPCRPLLSPGINVNKAG